MEINRTGQRGISLEHAQRTESGTTEFKKSLSDPKELPNSDMPGKTSSGVTKTDLKDPVKREQILNSQIGDMVNHASEELGVPLSDLQRRNLLEFLGNDPAMRGKLLSYLDQIAK